MQVSFHIAEAVRKGGFCLHKEKGGVTATVYVTKDFGFLRGEIYYADLDPHYGSEQGGKRPVIVIQNNTGNKFAPTVIVAAVTSKVTKKPNQPTHVLIDRNPAFSRPSMVLLEQIFTIDKERIQRLLGQATPDEMYQINEALMNSLDLNGGRYLEKKRINNLDETSFVYVKGNFEPIVSESLWHECERIRKSRISSLRLPDGETRRKGARTTKNLWVSKLRCRCGSSYRIFNWRKLKDGTPVFGYQCNMRTVNPTRSFVLEHNMTEQLSCDAISIPEWKLELMAKKIFEKVWGNQNKAILRACKMIESCQNGKAATRMSAAPIQGQIEKIKKRKLNYAAMRADGELPREEYQALCKQADDEIARLEQELKALSPAPEPQTVSSDMKAIYDFLSQKVDVHSARLAPELIDQFVEVVTPFADYSYRWKLNTGCKKSKEERTNLMAVSEKPLLTFTIDFETAKRYREANKMPHQFRRAAWIDLTVEVYL